jgi:hypothetical protein
MRFYPLIFILIIFPGLTKAQTREWILTDNINGIESYKLAKTPQNRAEFKAIATLNCRLDIIAVILKDFQNYPQWMPDCIEVRQIEKIDDNNILLYYLHHAPWPVRNRDAVLHVTSRLDTSAQALYITSRTVTDNRFPPADNPVRMAKMEADWAICFIDEKHTRVSYQLFSDPGGYIPASQANRFAANLPYETLRGLQRMICKPEYSVKAVKSPEKKIVEDYFIHPDKDKK